jgi:HIV Tat-specific factor 1
MATRAPFPTEPEEFNDDERVSFDQVTQTHKLEDENGEEWEWLSKQGKWVPVVRNSQNPVHRHRQALACV